jgi:hypothetical protein
MPKTKGTLADYYALQDKVLGLRDEELQALFAQITVNLMQRERLSLTLDNMFSTGGKTQRRATAQMCDTLTAAFDKLPK